MKATIISIPVLDQEKAEKFYTQKLGFIVKKDTPLSNWNKWLTLVSPEWQDGPEILLEPAPKDFEPSRVYQESLMSAWIPYTQFDVDDVEWEYTKLLNIWVEFSVKPTEMWTVKIAVFNDTCWNNIQIIQYL